VRPSKKLKRTQKHSLQPYSPRPYIGLPRELQRPAIFSARASRALARSLDTALVTLMLCGFVFDVWSVVVACGPWQWQSEL
jgi:hypothetical protein